MVCANTVPALSQAATARHALAMAKKRGEAGDVRTVDAGGWTEGKWVLVRHPDGQHRMHQCERRNGLELLVGAESVIFDPAVHVVIGIAVDRLERL